MKKVFKLWGNMALYTQIAIGGILGVIAGLILGDSAGVLEPFGTLFIQLLQMLIIPLVITSILAGMLKLQDSKAVGKVGGGFIIYLRSEERRVGKCNSR